MPRMVFGEFGALGLELVAPSTFSCGLEVRFEVVYQGHCSLSAAGAQRNDDGLSQLTRV